MISSKIAQERNGSSLTNPMARETIQIWDPFHKCKVTMYKDEFEKQLNKNFLISIDKSMKF